MPKIVYGTFKTETDADRLLGRLREMQAKRKTGDVYNSILHRGHVRGEDVQLGGSLGLVGGIVGGGVVGIVGGLAAALLIWPMAGVSFGWAEPLLMMIAGSMFGVVAGAVAGASETKSTIVQDAEDCEKRGECMVICEVDSPREVPELIDAFVEEGGCGVKAA